MRSPTIPRPVIAALAAFLAVSPFTALAQTSSSVPGGAIVFSIPAGTVPTPAQTFLSVPLRSSVEPSFVGAPAGRITSVTANSISVTGAAWPAGALAVSSNPALSAAPFFVRIMSGTATGRTLFISGNTADVLTVDNQGTDLSTLGILTGAATGDRFEIFPGHNLASFFGTTSTFVLRGASASVADNVQVFDTAAGVWRVYFLDAGGVWRQAGFGFNRNTVVLRPDSTMIFSRRGVAASFTVTGIVPSTDLRVVVRNSGPSVFGNVFPVVNMTLNSQVAGVPGLRLQNVPGWVATAANPGAGSASADKVLLFDSAGGVWRNFVYDSAQARWEPAGLSFDRNPFVVPLGATIILDRPGAATGVSSAVFSLPYTL